MSVSVRMTVSRTTSPAASFVIGMRFVDFGFACASAAAAPNARIIVAPTTDVDVILRLIAFSPLFGRLEIAPADDIRAKNTGWCSSCDERRRGTRQGGIAHARTSCRRAFRGLDKRPMSELDMRRLATSDERRAMKLRPSA